MRVSSLIVKRRNGSGKKIRPHSPEVIRFAFHIVEQVQRHNNRSGALDLLWYFHRTQYFSAILEFFKDWVGLFPDVDHEGQFYFMKDLRPASPIDRKEWLYYLEGFKGNSRKVFGRSIVFPGHDEKPIDALAPWIRLPGSFEKP